MWSDLLGGGQNQHQPMVRDRVDDCNCGTLAAAPARRVHITDATAAAATERVVLARSRFRCTLPVGGGADAAAASAVRTSGSQDGTS